MIKYCGNYKCIMYHAKCKMDIPARLRRGRILHFYLNFTEALHMRGIPSLITDIRKKVFTEVARMAYSGGDYTQAEDLP